MSVFGDKLDIRFQPFTGTKPEEWLTWKAKFVALLIKSNLYKGLRRTGLVGTPIKLRAAGGFAAQLEAEALAPLEDGGGKASSKSKKPEPAPAPAPAPPPPSTPVGIQQVTQDEYDEEDVRIKIWSLLVLCTAEGPQATVVEFTDEVDGVAAWEKLVDKYELSGANRATTL